MIWDVQVRIGKEVDRQAGRGTVRRLERWIHRQNTETQIDWNTDKQADNSTNRFAMTKKDSVT